MLTIAIIAGLPVLAGAFVLGVRTGLRAGVRRTLVELTDPQNARAALTLERINESRRRRKSWMVRYRKDLDARR